MQPDRKRPVSPRPELLQPSPLTAGFQNYPFVCPYPFKPTKRSRRLRLLRFPSIDMFGERCPPISTLRTYLRLLIGEVVAVYLTAVMRARSRSRVQRADHYSCADLFVASRRESSARAGAPLSPLCWARIRSACIASRLFGASSASAAS
jgi:hypothetical protein